MKLVKGKRKQFMKWFYNRKAKRNLLAKNREDIAVCNLLEAYITGIVLAGGEERREELAEMQRKIAEFDKFVKFLEKI